MTKKPCDEEDKVCLLQIFSLLTNLEAMSQEQNMAVDDTCPGYAVSKQDFIEIITKIAHTHVISFSVKS